MARGGSLQASGGNGGGLASDDGEHQRAATVSPYRGGSGRLRTVPTLDFASKGFTTPPEQALQTRLLRPLLIIHPTNLHIARLPAPAFLIILLLAR